MTPVKVTTKTFRAIVTFLHSWMKRKVSNYFLSWKNTSITLIPMVSFFLTREVRTFFLRYQKPLSEVSSDRETTRESISVLFRRWPLWRSEIITLFWVRRETKLPKVTHGHHLAHFHSFFSDCAVRPIILNTWRFRLGRGLLSSEKVSVRPPTDKEPQVSDVGLFFFEIKLIITGPRKADLWPKLIEFVSLVELYKRNLRNGTQNLVFAVCRTCNPRKDPKFLQNICNLSNFELPLKKNRRKDPPALVVVHNLCWVTRAQVRASLS